MHPTTLHINQSSSRIVLLLLIFFWYTGIFLFSFTHTELPSYEKIPLMDGNQYLKMWHYFNDPSLSDYKIDFPFNGRIAYVWLASLFPDSFTPFQSFIVLNYLFGLGIIYILAHTWHVLSLPLYPSFFLLGYLSLDWSGLIRQYMIDPIGVDIPYLLFLAILMHLIVLQKYDWRFVLVALIGTAVKEAIIPFLLVLLLFKLVERKIIFLENKKPGYNLSRIDKTVRMIAIALIGCFMLKFLISILFPSIQTGIHKNSVVMVVYYFYLILKDPVHIPNWLSGIAIFYGPLLYPFFKTVFHKKNFVPGTLSGKLWVLSFAGLLLAILGAGDHTRIAFLAFPFFFTCILLYWKENPPTSNWIIYLGALLYLTKCWRFLPTPTDNWETFGLWYPEYSSFRFFVTELIIVLLSILLLYISDRKSRNRSFISNLR